MIARRLCMYVGDVYRYQYMYLPLLSFSDIGPVDTDNILNLARWTYGRAKAMYFDNGRALDPDDDPLESLMVLFSQAVFASGGSGAAVSGIFQSLLDALHEDLAEIADSTAILNLDMDFWVREYQLSVILAALLTAITEDTEPIGLKHPPYSA
ncbi:hypothetical protein GGI07_000285 [Coemansia sp. Benny D115]|nr:hypothetical protein GGI07_000285 [Coemansia sp. Benny D115]